VNLPPEMEPELEVRVLFSLVLRLRIHGALPLLLYTYQHTLVGHKVKLTVGAYELKTIKISATLQNGKLEQYKYS
jgi:hypothetical protein